MFLRKVALKICCKFKEHPCRSVISIKLQSNVVEITLRHGCSPVNMLRIFRTLFLGTPLGGCFWFLLLLEDLSKTYFPLFKKINAEIAYEVNFTIVCTEFRLSSFKNTKKFRLGHYWVILCEISKYRMWYFQFHSAEKNLIYS